MDRAIARARGLETDAVEPFRRIRQATQSLAEGLSEADLTVQSMPDASPGKWHLAHTTWFFEEFLLCPALGGYRSFDPQYRYLFNSYYEAVGPRHPRALRGLLTRPGLDEVLAYRQHVDAGVGHLLHQSLPAEMAARLELGLHHEQQHQELLLTDLLHLFAQNPLRPAYRALPAPAPARASPLRWVPVDGGIHAVGHAGADFRFDCEGPRHEVLLRPFELASRPVSCAEWLEFMAAGGYADAGLWLADGRAQVNAQGWQAPLYWEERDGVWYQMTLGGLQPLQAAAPVCHVSYFEADAYARWASARLPTEAEWEVAACGSPIEGNWMDSGALRPLPATGSRALQQLYGDVWEWTGSAFLPYPGFRPDPGAIGEYNGKFMSGQFVLRGGSCASPQGHLRQSYRNFFQPWQRWQFSGLRLARDL